MAKRILIVEDHPIYREGLVRFVDSEPDLRVCAAVDSAADALDAVERFHPHAVLVDLKLRGSSGIWLVGEMRRRWPEIRILVVSMYDERRFAGRLLDEGANGFVMKDKSPEDVLAGLRTILAGRPYASESVKLQALLGTDQPAVTPRELDVIRMAGEGLSVDEIAGILRRSPKTVQNHIRRIQRKLGTPNRQTFYQRARDWASDQALAG